MSEPTRPSLFTDQTADTPSISAITPLSNDPNRASIKVGRQRVATLAINLIADLHLAVGQPWTPTTKTQVHTAVQFDKALAAALSRLNRRQYSRRELQQRLERLEHPAQAIDRVIAYLTDRQLLDDLALGQELIRQTTARTATAPRLLQAKLHKRGLAQETIDRLLEDNAPDTDQLTATAIEFTRKKMRSMANLDPQTRHRRLWSQLARRGFDNDTIEQVLNSINDSPHDESPL